MRFLSRSTAVSKQLETGVFPGACCTHIHTYFNDLVPIGLFNDLNNRHCSYYSVHDLGSIIAVVNQLRTFITKVAFWHSPVLARGERQKADAFAGYRHTLR